MNIRQIHTKSPGFALPTVLIASVVMLAVLTASVAAATSTRTALQGQYYNQLARDAAEGGLAMAKACIAAGTSTWANPLRPGGTCTGLAAQCTSDSCYVVKSTDVRSTFAVSTPDVAGNVSTVTITGTVEQTRSSTGAVWRTYTQTIRKQEVSSGSVAPSAAVRWAQVAAGGNHTCALSTDYKAYCWGQSDYGQVGDNSTTQRDTPVAVAQGDMPAGVTIRQLVAGTTHTCVIASDNKAYCWGYNATGQLGDNSTTNRLTPVAVNQGAIPAGATIRQIAVGGNFTCVIASDNKAYCWGYNNFGQLGNSSTTQSLVPVAVSQGAITAGATIRQITAGGNHTCAIASDNKAYCWGYNNYGQLGDNSSTQRTSPVVINRGAMANGVTIQQIVASTNHTCATGSDNGFYCWGYNLYGQVGDATTTNRDTPTTVALGARPSGSTVRQISVASGRTCIVASDNQEYCWGLNGSGQVGDNSTSQRNSPVAVATGAMSGLTSQQISAGLGHTCAVASNNGIYCWGDAAYGKLGDNTLTERHTPVSIVTINAVNDMLALQIATGESHTCAIASDNQAYCWGLNSGGQLGDNTTTQSNIPVAVNRGAIPLGSSIRAIANSITHTCAIASNNKVYCWGVNTNGQLGNNSTTQSNIPVAVSQGAMPSGAMVQQLVVGNGHTCVIASDNKAYCWGLNSYGQLGNNSTTQSLVPVAVSQGAMPSGALVRQIAVGDTHSCAIAFDNKPYCWGGNGFNQIGDNTSTDRLTPVAVLQGAMPSGVMVVQIAGAETHTCVIASDNKPYCWGFNSSGRVGDGTTTLRPTAVAVVQGAMPSGVLVQQLVTGGSHTCVIASDNKPYCWGYNNTGPLGDGTGSDRWSPVAVLQGALPSGSMVWQIAAGDLHTCAIASDNKPYCWGRNNGGRLGDNTTTSRYSPVSVSPFIVYPPATSNTYYF